MSELLFSVIVPVYNAQATLQKCADSILSQAPAESELLLVNDGSTDGSGEACDRLARTDPRVRVLHQPNGGASAARNAGLAAAQGRYLQFVDADDWLKPGLYAAVLPVLEAGADVCFFGVDSLSGLVNERLPQGRFESLAALRADFAYYLVDTGLFAALYNKIYRAEKLTGVRFDPALKINEDLLFSLQALARCGPVFFNPTLYYTYDDRADGTLSRRLRTDLLDAEEYTRPALREFLAAAGLSGAAAETVVRRRQSHVAMAQCSVLLGRRGNVPFAVYRRLFARALAPAHCRAEILDWIKTAYGPAARAVYAPCVRLRLAGALAAWCRLRNHL